MKHLSASIMDASLDIDINSSLKDNNIIRKLQNGGELLWRYMSRFYGNFSCRKQGIRLENDM